VWAEFLRISQLFSKQKHTCQHHCQWLGLFLAAWLFCNGLTDQQQEKALAIDSGVDMCASA